MNDYDSMTDQEFFLQIAINQMINEIDAECLRIVTPTPADGVVPDWLAQQISGSQQDDQPAITATIH